MKLTGFLSAFTAFVPLALAQIPAATVPQGLGFNIHFTDEVPGEVAQIAATGARLIRMDFSWVDIERSRGVYDFAAYDRLLAALERHRIRPIFILDYAHPLYDDNRSPDTDEGRAAFARFAAAGASHFRGRGVIWEIYNEPNIFPFWRPKPNVQDYIKLAEVTMQAVRQADPSATIIGPACSGIDLDFLRVCHEAGLLRQFAGISVHPYSQRGPEHAEEGYRQLRRLLRQTATNAASSVPQRLGDWASVLPSPMTPPILSGEWGYSDIWTGMDRRRQAAMLARQWLFNYSQGVPVSIWYDWRDDGLKPDDPEHHFGVVEHEPRPRLNESEPPFTPKPAYDAACALIRQLEGFTFQRRIWTGNEQDWFLLFSRGSQVRIAAWTTAPAPRRAGIPLSSGNVRLFDLFGQHRDTLDGFGDAAWLELTGEPQYLVPDAPNAALRLAAAWEPAVLEIDARLERSRGSVRWISRIHNPLNEPAGVLITTNPPPADAVESVHRRLQPGESAEFGVDLPLLRRPGVQFAEVFLCIAGFRHPIGQRVAIECVNPVQAELCPLSRNDVQLVVRVPPGEGFSGTLRLEGEFLDPQQNPQLPIALDVGGEPLRKLIRLTESRPQRPQVAVWMEDEAGAVELASVRFQELRLHPDLWKSEVEGDASVPAEHHTRFFPSAEGGSAAPAATEPRRATAGPPSVAEDQDAIPPGLAAATDAVRIDYRFAAGWRYLLLQAQTGHEPIVDRPATLGVWVKGDGSGNILRCRFVDSSGQTFQPDGPKLNFNDWRYITFPLDGRRSGHWGGDHSGIVRYPVRLQTLLLIDSAARQPTAGGVWVAGASLLED